MLIQHAHRSLMQPLLASTHLTKDVKMDGFAASIETQLQHEEGVNIADKHGLTPLMRAVGRGDVEKVRTLLARRAEVNAVDADGRTPLMIIAGWGRMETEQHLKITEMLLEHGAEFNISDKHGHTSLMAAAKWGRTGTVKIFLQHGAEANAVCHHGHTPLMRAARNGHVDVVKLLLEHGAKVNAADRLGYTPLMYAVWREHLQVAEILLQHKADINAVDAQDRSTLTLLTIKFYNHDMVELLIGHLLGHMSDTDQDQLTKILTTQEQRGGTLEFKLWKTLLDNHREGAWFLLKHGVDADDPDKSDYKPLIIKAAKNGHFALPNYCWSMELRFNATDNYGQTADGGKHARALGFVNCCWSMEQSQC